MAANILVVDDDADIRETLFEVLSYAGYEVATAANGKLALEQLAAYRLPDLVLLDLMMPVLNGFDFLQEVRKHPALASIPVIVASANRGYEASDLGVRELLRKPFEVDVLLTAVREAVKSRHPSREHEQGAAAE